MGDNLPDLLLNSETAQRVLGGQLPLCPAAAETARSTAIPGDGKVTLYWDDALKITIGPPDRREGL